MDKYTPDHLTFKPTGRSWRDLEPGVWHGFNVHVHGGLTATGHVVRLHDQRAVFVTPDYLGISLDILEVDLIDHVALLSSSASPTNDETRQVARIKALYGLDAP